MNPRVCDGGGAGCGFRSKAAAISRVLQGFATTKCARIAPSLRVAARRPAYGGAVPARFRAGATRERASTLHLIAGPCTPPRSHPRKRGPCSTLRRAACVVALLAHAPRPRSRAAWCGTGRAAACLSHATYPGLMRLLPQTGLRLTSRSRPDMGCGSLRALSQNRDSASRASLCWLVSGICG
jgi:hypothetical protein